MSLYRKSSMQERTASSKGFDEYFFAFIKNNVIVQLKPLFDGLRVDDYGDGYVNLMSRDGILVSFNLMYPRGMAGGIQVSVVEDGGNGNELVYAFVKAPTGQKIVAEISRQLSPR